MYQKVQAKVFSDTSILYTTHTRHSTIRHLIRLDRRPVVPLSRRSTTGGRKQISVLNFGEKYATHCGQSTNSAGNIMHDTRNKELASWLHTAHRLTQIYASSSLHAK